MEMSFFNITIPIVAVWVVAIIIVVAVVVLIIKGFMAEMKKK